ncbi:glycosyltransferase family 2 protein [Algoriphagus aquimarinus]|uniref:Glycosyltransferase n=1 Tax=Algoriphagus aquimarinus TaxID=237018 RepID=A0A5C7AA69_9BACT|nr:cellulose synthase catalytic subunit [Algoriphagus aquimarinus]TXE05152.1 glycosyltransferase [Algoriphagus aquimarinus]
MSKQTEKTNLWAFRRAKSSSILQKFFLICLITAGLISIGRLADWWFKAIHVGNLVLYLILSLIFWYGMLRLVIIWINYFGISRPPLLSAPIGKSVAIFTTSSPGEPLSMFEKTLEACSNITYPHTTYLLDDTKDPRFRAVAEKHGAVWLELVGLPGAKAGKINAAMAKTSEEFILVLDPDHIPFPNFLDEVLGYFDEEKVGFVQVSQAYYNQSLSFTAKAASEQTYTFYGPTQMGMNGYNCAVAIGANCTFRRKALESAGGHGIGLAEDLVTSIRIHAAGWKSIYAPIVVSRGLVPEDFGSFCKQQLKWARGVHEVLFSEVPKLFRKLSFWQKLSYITIGTYYLEGLISFIYLTIPFMFFWFGLLPARMFFIEFIYYGFPVLFFSTWIYFHVQRWLVHGSHERGIHWRGMIMKFACWPVYLMGFVLSVLDKEIPYIPTSKQAVAGKMSVFAKPLLIQIILYLGTLIWVIYNRYSLIDEVQLISSSEITYGMLAFGFIPFVLACLSLYAVWESSRLTVQSPWESISLKEIQSPVSTALKK